MEGEANPNCSWCGGTGSVRANAGGSKFREVACRCVIAKRDRVRLWAGAGEGTPESDELTLALDTFDNALEHEEECESHASDVMGDRFDCNCAVGAAFRTIVRIAESRALSVAAPREASEAEASDSALIEMLELGCWQLDFDGDERTVDRIHGGVNDRQWTEVGRGHTLREALVIASIPAALRAATPSPEAR